MSNKPPDDKDNLMEVLKKIGAPIAGFIGAVTLAYNFYQLWLGDQQTVPYITSGIGLIVLVIVLCWVGFSKRTVYLKVSFPIGAKFPETNHRYPFRIRRVAWFSLGIIFLGAIVGVYLIDKHRDELRDRLIVLIATFDGPEDFYGLHNEIVESMNTDFLDDSEVMIIPRKEVITLDDGSSAARALGKRYLADVVIWGWYRPTENPNITIHIENLALDQLAPLEISTSLRPSTTLAELESFTFQQQVGQQTGALISFLVGFVKYQAEDYESAVSRFDQSVENLQETPKILDNFAEIYFYRATTNVHLGRLYQAVEDYDTASEFNSQVKEIYFNRGIVYEDLGEYQGAIQDFDRAIRLDPYVADSYYNRGNAYVHLEQYDLAIQDYDKAIELDPQNAWAYSNRGVAHFDLGKYDRAIQDFSKSIEIDPEDAETYAARGAVYAFVKQYDRAIEDFDQAIRMDSNYFNAYIVRGTAYAELGQYALAMQDYDKAIKLNSQNAKSYYGRGLVYSYLGQYESAIQDYDNAIELDPQHADAYRDRGLAYQALSKTAEAEADFKKYEELTGQKP